MNIRQYKALTDYRAHLILEAGCNNFIKHGYKKTTIEEVSKDAGISKPIIYRYFKNKEELFLGVAAKEIAQFIPIYKERLGEEITIENQINACIETLFDLINKNAFLQKMIEDKEQILIWNNSDLAKEVFQYAENHITSILKEERYSKEGFVAGLIYLIYQTITGLFTETANLFHTPRWNRELVKESFKEIISTYIKI